MLVVENFSPGTMDRFKVGYAQLKAANPEDNIVLDFRIRADRADDFRALRTTSWRKRSAAP